MKDEKKIISSGFGDTFLLSSNQIRYLLDSAGFKKKGANCSVYDIGQGSAQITAEIAKAMETDLVYCYDTNKVANKIAKKMGYLVTDELSSFGKHGSDIPECDLFDLISIVNVIDRVIDPVDLLARAMSVSKRRHKNNIC